MKKVAIVDELQQLKKNQTDNGDEAVKEVKLLMAGSHAQDMNIMRHLAGNSVLVNKEKELGKLLEMEKLEQQYGEVFTVDQIKTLAIKYHLRFLSSSRYTGKMEMQTISRLKQFAKETSTSIDEYTLSRNFFILAPAECFNMEKISLSTLKAEEEEKKRREMDPVLFYKIDDNHYRMIHKWGTDFSIWRKFLGWKYKNESNLMLTAFLTTMIILGVISIPIVMSISNFWLGISGAAAIAFIISAGRAAKIANNRQDSNGKPRSAFYGETNWNSPDMMVH